MSAPRCAQKHVSRLRLTAGLVALVIGVSSPVARSAWHATQDGTPPPAAASLRLGEIGPGVPGLLSVPLPVIGDLEDAVREQLSEAQDELRLVIKQSQGDEQAERGPLLATAYAHLGRLYHAYDLWAAAATCYENALRLTPGDPRLHYALAELARSEGRLDAARTHYQQVLVLRPDDLAALVHLGDLEYTLNRLEDAELTLQQALQIDEGCAAARALLGRIALARGDAQAAVDQLTVALEHAPEANRLHYPLGMAYRALGDLGRAREHLAASGEVGVTVASPMVAELQALETGERLHLLRGRQAYAAGRYRSAAASFRRAVDASPESRRARVNLGVALAGLGDLEGGVAQLREAVRLDPESVDARYNLGLLLARAGDDEEATTSLRQAVQLDPDDTAARLGLADLLRSRGRSAEALQEYTTLSMAQPTLERARLAEAQLLVQSRRYAEALERLEDAHALMPWQGPIARALARLLAACPEAKLRDGARALELALQVHASSPTPGHAETVALALAELERCTEAARWQREAIQAAVAAGDDGLAQGLQRALARYEAGAPCRPPVD